MHLVKELMTAHPHLVDPESTLRQAAEIMKEFDCGSLVVGEDSQPEGMVTDRDIVIWGLAEGHDPDLVTAGDIMTVGTVICYEDDSVERAADIMSENDVRRLVIMNRKGRVTGVLSVVDIVKSGDRNVVNDDVMHHLYKYA